MLVSHKVIKNQLRPFRHGHWIHMMQHFSFPDKAYKDWKIPIPVIVCSVCGKVYDEPKLDKIEDIIRYCPFCGSKMDGKEDQ